MIHKHALPRLRHCLQRQLMLVGLDERGQLPGRQSRVAVAALDASPGGDWSCPLSLAWQAARRARRLRIVCGVL